MSNDARNIFRRNLIKITSVKNIKQTDIALKGGFPLSTVSSWFNGQSYPRVDKMQKLADILDVSMKELVEDVLQTDHIIPYSRLNKLNLSKKVTEANINKQILTKVENVLKANNPDYKLFGQRIADDDYLLSIVLKSSTLNEENQNKLMEYLDLLLLSQEKNN